MLGKILNIGKKKEFYLTIDETQEAVSDAVETISETVTEVATETVSKVKEVVESAPNPEEIVEPTVEVATKSTKTKATKKTAKAKSKVATKPQSEKKPAAPVYSGASSWEEPFWVKAMYKTSSSDTDNGTAENTNKTFATDYLLVKSTSRRRPGPSLNKFKDMVSKKKF